MKKFKAVVAVALLLGGSVAHAGSATSGYISNILTLIDDHSVLFNQSGTRSGVPSCGASYPSRWSIDASTAMGQAQLSLILTAYSLHKPIIISGTGDCRAHPDSETVDLMVIDG